MPWCHNNFNSLQEKNNSFSSPVLLIYRPSPPLFIIYLFFLLPLLHEPLALELISGDLSEVMFLCSLTLWSYLTALVSTSESLQLPGRSGKWKHPNKNVNFGAAFPVLCVLENSHRLWILSRQRRQVTPRPESPSQAKLFSISLLIMIIIKPYQCTSAKEKRFPSKLRSVLRLPLSCCYFQLVFFSTCKLVTHTSWTAFILY